MQQLMIKKPFSHSEAAEASKPTLMDDGVCSAEIVDAVFGTSRKNRPQIVVTCAMLDGAGNERQLPIYLNDSRMGALMLRSTCEAVGALAAYEAGAIEAGLFPGHHIRVQIGTERKRGWPARNVILAVMPAESAVVTPLRAAG